MGSEMCIRDRHYYPNLDRAEATVEASSLAILRRRKRRSALCPRHAVVVLVCSSKEQPLVSSVMRCCAASRSAVDARLAGRLHARAQGSGCGGDWRRAAACCALSSCQARPMVPDDAQLEGCGTARSSTLSVFAAAGASRSSPVRPAPRACARLQLRRRLAARCCVLRLKLLSGAADDDR